MFMFLDLYSKKKAAKKNNSATKAICFGKKRLNPIKQKAFCKLIFSTILFKIIEYPSYIVIIPY